MTESSLPQESIFAGALEISPADRPAYLDRVCEGNCALRAEVEKLLQAHERTGNILDMPQHPETASDDAQLAPGAMIGHYQLIEKIGAGGMGVVYRAFDQKHQSMVALKTLQGVDPAALYRLKQEFRTLADISHQNLVNFHEIVVNGQLGFLAMELIEGVDFLTHVRSVSAPSGEPTIAYEQSIPTREIDSPLASGLRAGGNSMSHGATNSASSAASRVSISLDRFRNAFCQLTAAITALHDFGKLHCDLKPSNVLVTPEGRLVVLDFGLAAELDRAGQQRNFEQGLAGTVAYMSPEQAAGHALSAASDWYSVGVILYECLTGCRPFRGNVLQILRDKQEIDPPPCHSLTDGIPEELAALCTDLLSREPAARPAGPEILRRLGAAGARRAELLPVALTAAPFIGRAGHLTALQNAFDVTRNGGPAMVLVQGRSGTGKSLLVEHFLGGLVARHNALVFSGKCYEYESVPYKALDGLIDALSRHLRNLTRDEVESLLPREIALLAEVFPVLARIDAVAANHAARMVDAQDARRRAFAALRELTTRLARIKPLVLFIDDLQWGDEESAAELAALLRPPEPPVLLLVVSYRSEEAASSACLRALLPAEESTDDGPIIRHVTVESLTELEALQLARACLGTGGKDRQVEAVARESAGNPFFVQVLAQRVAAESKFGDEPGETSIHTIDQLLWEQIVAMPDDARRFLELVAVSGQPLPQRDAFAAASLGKQDPKVLSLLRANRLLRSAGQSALEEVETYHDRVREAIVAHLPRASRAGHHLRLAETLERSTSAHEAGGIERTLVETGQHHPVGRRVFDLAYHFDAGGDSARALPYALAAAEQARSQYALRNAEQQYRIAERGATDDTTSFRIAEGLGAVLTLGGKYADAEKQLLKARALAGNRTAEASTACKLGELAFERGDLLSAEQAYEYGVRRLGRRVPHRSVSFGVLALWEGLVQALHTQFPSWFLGRYPLQGQPSELPIVRLHSRLCQVYWFSRGRIPFLWAHLRAMNLAERHGPTIDLGYTYSVHGPAMGMMGKFGRAVTYCEKALAIHKSLGHSWGQGQALHFYGVMLYTASRFAECIEKCRAAMELLERMGDPWECNSARFQIVCSLYRLGNHRGAIEEAHCYYEAARVLGATKRTGPVLGIWGLASGGKVPNKILQAELAVRNEDVQRTSQVLLAEAARLLAENHPAEAAETLNKAQHLVDSAGIRNQYVSPLLPWLATALRQQAEQSDFPSERRRILMGRARVVARRALRLARKFQNELPHALRENALQCAFRGRTKRARQLLDKSLAVAERQAARYEYAQSLLARGQIGMQYGWSGAAEDMEAANMSLLATERSCASTASADGE